MLYEGLKMWKRKVAYMRKSTFLANAALLALSAGVS